MLDLVFTVALSSALLFSGAVAVALLPWSDDELDRTWMQLKGLTERKWGVGVPIRTH